MRVRSHLHVTTLSQRCTTVAWAATSVCLMAVGQVGAAQAANDGDSRGLEEITVTAQRIVQSAIDVPMSISAIGGAELAAAGIENALDLSFAVPGLTVAETGPGRQVIVIRGIGSIRGSSSLTGVYLDEIPVTGAQDGFIQAYIDLRTIDLDRVEVLKGPQGTLFGEGAAGGVVRFITKDPDLTAPGGALATEFYDTANGGWSEEVTGVVNLPLGDLFGIRVAALYENKAGWIDQPSIGREDINDSEVRHVRVKALYTPTPELKVKGTAEIHRNKGGASNIVNQEPRGDSNFLQAFDRNAPTDFSDDYDLFNLTATYEFGFAELLSSTSYAEAESRQSFTQLLGAEPTPWLEILIRDLPQHAKIVSQEVRLTSAGDGPVNWSLGGSYKDADLTAGLGGSGLDAVLFGGDFLLTGASAGEQPTSASKSWAAFANAGYLFANGWEIGGGLRYFTDEREAFDRVAAPGTLLSDDFSKTTYRIYLKYAFSQHANVYFNVATGFRSGGFNGPSVGPLGGPQSYGVENTLFYEAGTKLSLLEGRLRFSGALFYGEYQDMLADRLITSPVDNQPLQYTSNGQDSELKGLEWDIAWAATDHVTLSFAGDVTDSEIVRVDPLDPAPAYFIGDPISLVPKYSLSTAVDYTFQWSQSMPGILRLSFDKKGKAYYSDRTNPLVFDTQVMAPELSFLNASVGGEWSGWKWTVFGRNLLDEDGPLSPTVTGWSAQSRPRTIGLSMSKSF